MGYHLLPLPFFVIHPIRSGMQKSVAAVWNRDLKFKLNFKFEDVYGKVLDLPFWPLKLPWALAKCASTQTQSSLETLTSVGLLCRYVAARIEVLREGLNLEFTAQCRVKKSYVTLAVITVLRRNGNAHLTEETESPFLGTSVSLEVLDKRLNEACCSEGAPWPGGATLPPASRAWRRCARATGSGPSPTSRTAYVRYTYRVSSPRCMTFWLFSHTVPNVRRKCYF